MVKMQSLEVKRLPKHLPLVQRLHHRAPILLTLEPIKKVTSPREIRQRTLRSWNVRCGFSNGPAVKIGQCGCPSNKPNRGFQLPIWGYRTKTQNYETSYTTRFPSSILPILYSRNTFLAALDDRKEHPPYSVYDASRCLSNLPRTRTHQTYFFSCVTREWTSTGRQSLIKHNRYQITGPLFLPSFLSPGISDGLTAVNHAGLRFKVRSVPSSLARTRLT
jgi:hypothetical protein